MTKLDADSVTAEAVLISFTALAIFFLSDEPAYGMQAAATLGAFDQSNRSDCTVAVL